MGSLLKMMDEENIESQIICAAVKVRFFTFPINFWSGPGEGRTLCKCGITLHLWSGLPVKGI
jgi:hypothetical protein